MKRAMTLLLLLSASFAMAGSPPAESTDGGQVQLPLDVYTRLLEQASDPSLPPRPAPAGHALGNAGVTVTVGEATSGMSAIVSVQLGIEVLEDDWVLVPVLPSGTSVESATIAGRPVQLLATPRGLAWGCKTAGSYTMLLRYKVDANRSQGGYTLPVPLPRAAAINLTATLPGNGLDATVIPAAGTTSADSGSTTRLTATVPTTSGVQISWRVPADRAYTISRASYEGRLEGQAVIWTGNLGVELFIGESVTLPLLPRSVTLSDLRVDGKNATILVAGERFATLVKGQGLHEVAIVFQTPVHRGEGTPRIDLRIPAVPVSRFELELPGDKELAVQPLSNVIRNSEKGVTRAVVHVPMTEHVTFSWSEAVPDEIATEIRANAVIYHTIHAEEGVLFVRAMVVYDVTRGETNAIDLMLPPEVQINRIDSASGIVADWRLGEPDDDGACGVTVFLNRQLQGILLLDVYYDRSLPAGDAADADPEGRGIDVPLIRAMAAQRQKGMVALLASTELALTPLEAIDANKVGENQLPAFVREAVGMTIAHTYKYAESAPTLRVATAAPERLQGKFDATVDTLISLGDVTLTGTASIRINVKSGSIMDLQLELPDDVSLLNLTAPALRTHRVGDGDGPRLVDVEFTQEMKGQFALDLKYERILVDGESEVSIPTVAVRGAEVGQGRIAIEALSAVEVLPAVTEQLTSLDLNELPQQLVLQTTNPILLAYKYVHTELPHRLALEVTRHRVLGVQEAAIDRASYKTLFTPDGLLVTTAEFQVRNSSKQFLRIRLPVDSEVWSVFVDGKPERPALADGDGDGKAGDVLVKIINSTRPFSVQLIYATSGSKVAGLGSVRGLLPNPDILVTRSRWDVYLPERLRYGALSTNMELVQDRESVSAAEMKRQLSSLADEVGHRAIEPLRISVPAAGIHYAFEKLYANQADQETWFELPYASARGAVAGHAISLVGIALFWLGIGLFVKRTERLYRMGAVGVNVAGVAALFVSLGVFQMSATLPLVVSLVLLLVVAIVRGRGYFPLGQLSTVDGR